MENCIYFFTLIICYCVDHGSCGSEPLREVNVNWTRDAVQQYTSSSPLELTLGDELVLHCQEGSYSNAWRQTSFKQYENCDCADGNGVTDECNPETHRFGECVGIARTLRFDVVENSQTLTSSRVFEPDTYYYFTSYSDGLDSLDAFSDEGKGGECLPSDSLPGLRMAVFVRSTATETTEPPVFTDDDDDDDDEPIKTDGQDPNVGLPSDKSPPPIPGGEDLGSGSGISIVGGAGLTDSAASSSSHLVWLTMLLCVTIAALLR